MGEWTPQRLGVVSSLTGTQFLVCALKHEGKQNGLLLSVWSHTDSASVCVWSYIFLNLELSADCVVHPEYFISEYRPPSQSITTARILTQPPLSSDTQPFVSSNVTIMPYIFKNQMQMSHLAFDFLPSFCEI